MPTFASRKIFLAMLLVIGKYHFTILAMEIICNLSKPSNNINLTQQLSYIILFYSQSSVAVSIHSKAEISKLQQQASDK